MGDYYITTEDIGRQHTCIKTVERVISGFKKFDILNKTIKLETKDFSPTRSCRLELAGGLEKEKSALETVNVERNTKHSDK